MPVVGGASPSLPPGDTLPTVVLLSTLLALATLQKDRTETLGYSYAQILAMGPSRWETLVLKKAGDSTAATASGFSVYGDALAWRNDRLLKGRPFPLRRQLESFAIQAQEVGNTATGGGTIWQIFAGQIHRDQETAIYRILTHSYRGPHRVVSDVTRAVNWLGGVAKRAEGRDRADADKAMLAIRGDLKAIAASARSLPRRDSDAALEFCLRTALAVIVQSKPQDR